MLAGREAERRRLGEILDGARQSVSGVLVVHGEAGIGKSALLAAAVAEAGDMVVLRTRGVESEAELPYAALHRLLRPALGELGALPAPQADALRGAFGIRAGRADDRFLVSLAVLSLLGDLSEQAPVLCVLDDAHWLDGASAQALAFVARRLQAEAVAMILAVRSTQPHRFPLDDLPMLRLAGLDEPASSMLLAAHAGDGVHPDVRQRLVQATGGNPLALVELARTLPPAQLSGADPLPVPLPLTVGVEQAFLEQVRRLPEPTQTLLLAAAAEDTGRLATIIPAAAVLGVDAAALGPAEQAGVISIRAGLLEFRHPLVRSAIYQGSTFTERRAAHRALAAVLDAGTEADRRVWHRAAAVVGPDAEVAGDLDRAAARSRERGAFAAAAAAYERAAELTADPVPRARRLTDAARNLWLAGHGERAVPLLSLARPLATDLLLRTEIDELRGIIELGVGVAGTAYRILRAAAEQVAPHDVTRALELLTCAGEAASLALDTDGEVALGRLAGSLDVGTGGTRERFLVNLLVGFGRQFAGEPAAAAGPLAEAIALADALAEPHLLLAAGRAAFYLGDDAAARRFSAAVVSRARDSGEIGAVPIAGQRLALSELFAGQWAVGAATAAEALQLARDTGQTEFVPLAYAWLALAAAMRGQTDQCREYAAQASAVAADRPMGLIDDAVRWALGLLELGLGNPPGALVQLRGISHPVVQVFSSLDRVEAAYLAGDHAAAQDWLAELEMHARHTQQPWALARAAHGHALLTSAEQARQGFVEALRHHERASRPFEKARTQLAYGLMLRRARRRADARRPLRAAFDGFEQLGAAPWAERAGVELRACGQAVRRADGTAVHRLTAQEVQVAGFVARGLSNADVAAQLFLSRRTVDYHLRNVFTKLGITSRTELAHLLGGHRRVGAG